MKDFLEDLAKNLMEKPEEVVVNESYDQSGTVVLTLKVASEEMGKIIGKEGRIIKAIRDLTRILAIKENRRVNVVLAEPERNPGQEEPPQF